MGGKMRVCEIEHTYEQLQEINRQYLSAVLEHHPELGGMVPSELLFDAKPEPEPEPEPTNPSLVMMPVNELREAARETARKHSITVAELVSRSKSTRYTLARQDFVRACRSFDPPKSYQNIGRFMGGRDWATVIHYERATRELEAA
jgi:hypothetical protein